MFFSPNHLKAGCYLTISSEPRPSIVVFKRTTSISEEIWFKVVFSETMIFLKIKYINSVWSSCSSLGFLWRVLFTVKKKKKSADRTIS